MPEHLILPATIPLDSRRAGGGGGRPPQRDYGTHGRKLRKELASAKAPRTITGGIDPNLVFKIRTVSRPRDTDFGGRDLHILGETVAFTYFVLAGDNGNSLDQYLAQYSRDGTGRSFINLVEEILPYDRQDRIGPGIDNIEWSDGDFALVDITIWPSDDQPEAERRWRVIEDSVLSSNSIQLLHKSISPRRSVVRVKTTKEGLEKFLELSVVEQVRTPPVPFLDFRDWWAVDIDSLPLASAPSQAVGLLDDSPHGYHPLLQANILSDESLAPIDYIWQPRSTHGTEVAGRILYPNLETELRDQNPLTAVGGIRSVRILEPDPESIDGRTRFALYAPPHELVQEAIRHLHGKYGVRIFNLSVGYSEPFSDVHLGPLTETIDDLARELDIVIVVPTGNASIGIDGTTGSGHHIIRDSPEYFFTPNHRLSEPGPAALAITVGSIARSDSPAEIGARIGWQAAAAIDEASPFSRSGPGLGTAASRTNKPDVVDYGGNFVLNDLGYLVQNDPGVSVVTTSMRDNRLFAAVNGTSYAAPIVSRLAADVLNAYGNASANLIRALIASSATEPGPARRITESPNRQRVYGNGLPNSHRATISDTKRVTMMFDGEMGVDTVQIHPIPVPESFRGGPARQRNITVALAFDPPVRRQRREYLASTMKFDIYRDIDPQELAEILERQDPDDPNEPIKDRRRLKMKPGTSSLLNSTVQVRTWSRQQSFIDDTAQFYIAVTNKAQTWARDLEGYSRQRYALTVTLGDEFLTEIDLYQELRNEIQQLTRVRIAQPA